jgi:outer membrane receptor protein involved in Fe transport
LGRVNPVFVDPRARGNNNYIRELDYDVNASFEDYEVQVNVMPRLAFSFPISDAANFFAHYDVLVQRPPSNTIATPLQFFNFPDRTYTAGNPLNNPNLRPEKTVDYEVGFQQKLSNSSALKISAYYKEMRDMIQLRTFQFVAGNSAGEYTTYDNQDFGTVKGFSFQYDLRRTGNFSLQANYTLQFADGTGSDPNSQAGLTNQGNNLRDLAPLNFDERHRIVATADYRFASGRRYNGPRIGGLDILSNFGVNLPGMFVSGRPYTPRRDAFELTGRIIDGTINSARLPANITVNLRVDKQFRITDKMGLNIYIRVQNLLDRRNVLNVYTATGSPTDDGFLITPDGQRRIQEVQNSARQLEAYLASYRWARINPDFFTLPRRVYLGAIFNF